MRTLTRRLADVVAFCLSAIVALQLHAADGPYQFQKNIPIGGAGGGWDYMSIDEVNRRLYVSHATSVAVVDIEKDVLVGVISNTPGVHGVIAIPEFNRGFISVGRENKVTVFDLKTLNLISKIDTGENPDAMVYDPGRRELYVFNGRSRSATVLEPSTGEVLTTIALDGQPEFAAADPAGSRVYNNLEDKSQLAVIDANSHQVVGHWALAPGQFPSGMAIDLVHHRLFVGCHNKLMVMLDSTNGKVVGSVPIGLRVDANAFDPGTQFAFASCGDGTLTVAHEDAPDKLTIVQTLPTERGSRTMALDPKTHRVFVASAKYTPPPKPAPGLPTQGPKVIPESFGVMVFELRSVGH